MNERIDELIEECTSVNNDLVYDGSDSYMQTTEYFDKEKFAELIVRECVDVISKEVSMKYKDGSGETEEFMAGHYGGSLLARVVIAQHFGVEK